MILMKNLILILIFAAVGLNTMASNPVHVIITAGQSNTDGRTPNCRHILKHWLRIH